MKNKQTLSYLMFFVLVILLNSCKKDLSQNLVKSDNGSSKKAVNAITPYNFNWEVGDYMPAPNGTSILKPWASGANQSFPLIYATDIKATDGWQLVYNTFNTTQLNPPLYFVLYNPYRGVLRAYFYLNPITPIPSSNVTHTLVQRAATSAPVISYSAANAVDLSVTSSTTSLAQPFKTTATGTWYAAEFEMAYDPAVGTKEAGSNLMSWELNSINVSNLTLNGTSQGSITGTIAQAAPPSPSMFGSLINGALQLGGLAELGPLKEGASVFKTALSDALKAGLAGSVKNVSNGIFGGVAGADSIRQYVHLTTNSTYTFTGTSTDVYPLTNVSMVIPGSKNQELVTGYKPLYPYPLGLMTLSAAPTAYAYEIVSSQPGNSGRSQGLKFNPNSYSIIWNSSIVNNSQTGVSIANIKQEIITYQHYYGNNPFFVDEGTYNPAALETDGISNYYKDSFYPNNDMRALTVNTCYGCDNSDQLLIEPLNIGMKMPDHILRISFDVIPNNGAAKVTIAKSFYMIFQGFK